MACFSHSEPVIKVSNEGTSAGRYAAFNIANLLAIQQRERVLASMLAKRGLADLSGREILDIGCGGGGFFLRLMAWGALAQSLHGVDLQAARVRAAQAIHPALDVVQGDAAALPWPDRRFDMVTQFTTFTSILDDAVRKRAAEEVDRVLKPGGILVWYDFWLNPSNRETHPVPAKELNALFNGYQHDLRRVTLAPPIARAVVPRSQSVGLLLQQVWFLQSHLLGVFIKPARP